MRFPCSLIVLAVLSAYLGNTQVSIPIEQDFNNSHKGCAVKPPSKEQIKYTLDVIDQEALRNNGTTKLPMRLHIVRQSNGSGGVDLDWVNLNIAQLNNRLYPIGIEWYIADINYIDNSTFYDFDAMTEEEAMCGPNEQPDAANVFFVNSLNVDGVNFCGFSYYPVNMPESLRLFMRNDCMESATNGTFVHEFGHFFNLFHTHEGTENGNTHANAEHVARTGPQSNCSTKGDLLCDTNADPAGNINANCMYIDGATDIYGNTYNPPVNNIMSYYPKICGWNFTPQQYSRMNGGLSSRLAHNAYNVDGANPQNVTDPSNLTVAINTQYQVVLNWSDNASNEAGYLIERSLDGVTFEPLFLGGVGPNTTSYIDIGVLPNTMYYYRIKASNDNADHYTNVANIFSGQIYCTPTHQSDNCSAAGVGVGIQNFMLLNGTTPLIDNNSGCGGPLSIYNGIITPGNITTATSYNFSAETINSGGSYIEQNLSIWIDANQDGDFDDSNELLYQSNFTPPAPVTITGSIAIPNCALSGVTTLRVRTRYLPNGVVSEPCGFYNFGEAEDYPVNVSSSVGTNPQITVNENSGVPNDNSICDGDPATLTASGGVTYLWDNGTTNPVRVVNSGNTYTVTVTNSLGCTDTESVSIAGTVSPTATIFVSEDSGAQSNDGLLCAGDNAQLIAGGGSTFLWENNGSQAIRTVSNSGTYSLTVTTSNGCSDQTSVSLDFTSVNADISLSENSGHTPNDGNLCDGDIAELTASGGVSYLWENGSSNSVRQVTSTGTYQVTVFDAGGCSDIESINLSFTGAGSTDIVVAENSGNTSNDGQLCAGDVAQIIATGGAQYLWSTGANSNAINASESGTYTVSITTENGCVSVESLDITVKTSDQAVIDYDDASGVLADDGVICSGSDVTLIASTGQSYLWENGWTNALRTVSSAGTYNVTITDFDGCTSATSSEVSVTPLPDITISIEDTSGSSPDDGNLCNGDSALLNASGGNNYIWNTGSNNPTITVSSGGTYSVTATDQNACSASDQASITVSETINGGIQVSDSSGSANDDGRLCDGESAVLTAFGGSAFLWEDGSTNAERTVFSSGNYTVTLTNSAGCQVNYTSTILVDPLPLANITILENSGNSNSDGLLCEGDEAILQASGGVSYQWDDGSTNLNRIVSTAGTYQVTVYNAQGCSSTSVTTIDVISMVESDIEIDETSGDDSDDGLLCEGDIATLTALGGTSYQWNTGQTNASIQVSSEGNYTVTITNANGCTEIEDFYVQYQTVQQLPIVVQEESGNLSDDGVLCAGDIAQLTAGNGTSYLWDNGSTTPSISVGDQGEYRVTVTQTGGCSYVEQIAITTHPLPQASIQYIDNSGLLPNDGEFCAGDNLTLQASGNGSYEWNTGNTSQTLSVDESGFYAVTVTSIEGCQASAQAQTTELSIQDIEIEIIEESGSTNNDGVLCDGASANLVIQDITNIQWSTGSNDSAIAVNSAGSYTVSGLDSQGCDVEDQVTISVNSIQSPEISISESSGLENNDGLLCNGDTALLSTIGSNVVWSNGATTTSIEASQGGDYSVTVSDNSGCSASSNQILTYSELPEVTVTIEEESGLFPNDNVLCDGDAATITVVTSDEIEWEDGSNVNTKVLTESGSYKVNVSNAFGCVTESEVSLSTNENPDVAIEINENSGGVDNDGIIDFGDTALLSAKGANSYLWDDGTTIDVRFVSEEGDYSVTGTSMDGCEGVDVATIVYSPILSLYEIQLVGEVQGDYIDLTWKVTSDDHLVGYRIERSLGSGQFDQIGYLESSSSAQEMTYSLIDNDIDVDADYYYRISAERMDGELLLSNVIALQTGPTSVLQNPPTQVYPNPSVSTLYFEVNNTIENSEVSVDIIDSSGRILERGFYLGVAEQLQEYEYFLDVSSLNSGLYIFRLNVGPTAKDHKIIIQK